MRAQYNFWPGARGLDAWDVRRLIRLSSSLPVRMIPLADLAEIDDAYWYNFGEKPTVRSVAEHAKLISEVDPSYAIILATSGRVMDGMHRVARALLHDELEIVAVQFDVDPTPDFRDCRPEDLPYDDEYSISEDPGPPP